jgi:cell wall-associated NlpC family hydrolase
VLVTATVTAVALSAAGAGAASKPTISSVKAKVSTLQGQVDKIGQEYDAAGLQLKSAQAKLTTVTKQANRAQAQYNQASATLVAVANASYEDAGQSSVIGLLTSGNPEQVLNAASLVLQVENTHNEQAQQLLTTAQELASIKDERTRTEAGVKQLTAKYGGQKKSMTKLLDTQTSLLSSLTSAQQEAVAADEVGGSTSTGTVVTAPTTYTGTTSTEAGKAVAFAFAQLGCVYVYGATGPCADGFDCSGLTQAAWAAAGVGIPRTTYEDWSGLPHVPTSDMEAGDLLLFNGESHIAIYVGNGMIIDAPHTGAVVEEIPESESWYADNLDGVVRP